MYEYTILSEDRLVELETMHLSKPAAMELAQLRQQRTEDRKAEKGQLGGRKHTSTDPSNT